jgi:hypothetical protein
VRISLLRSIKLSSAVSSPHLRNWHTRSASFAIHLKPLVCISTTAIKKSSKKRNTQSMQIICSARHIEVVGDYNMNQVVVCKTAQSIKTPVDSSFSISRSVTKSRTSFLGDNDNRTYRWKWFNYSLDSFLFSFPSK